jgi:hypothetical protein
MNWIFRIQYVTDDNVRKALDDDEWVIEIDFDGMKTIFEPVIQRIFRLIEAQLDNAQENCSAIFLVGGFSESKYLQKRIKEGFSHRVNNISTYGSNFTWSCTLWIIYNDKVK